MGFWSKLKRSTGDWDDSDIREELESHLAMEEADRGDRRESRMRLGNLTRIEEDSRRAGLYPWLESIARDIHYGWRQILKTPALSASVVVSLAIGLGANSAIFSLVDAALIRPLPVEQPEQLEIISWSNVVSGMEGVNRINGMSSQSKDGRTVISSVSEEVYREFAKNQDAFEDVAGFASSSGMAISVPGRDGAPAEQVDLNWVSSNYFPTLGIQPALGRWFLPDEDQAGQEPAVVLSHRYWTNQLGADPEVTGKTVRVNDIPCRVIGVAPAGFFGLEVGQWADIYAPLSARRTLLPYDQDTAIASTADFWWVQMIARRRNGETGAQQTAQETGLFRTIAGQSLDREIPDTVRLESHSGARGMGMMGAGDAEPLWILSALVGVLLLIVCANVANLLLSRSVARQREMAVRAALGATRSRLFRQQITESGLFAMLGGIVGVGLGYALALAIHAWFQNGYDSSSAFDLRIDARILLFSAAAAGLTAFLFGIAPAIRAARGQVNETLKSHATSVVEGKMFIRKALVAAQFALCFTALVAAALLGQSLQNLVSADVGFERENLSYLSVHPRQVGYTDEQMKPYETEIVERLEAIPGVQKVAPIETRLLSGGIGITSVTTPNGPKIPENTPFNLDYAVIESRVGEGALETLKIPLLAGRMLERGDWLPNTHVAVVDDRFAKKYFPDENPVGKVYETNGGTLQVQVVGVVQNSRHLSPRRDPLPTIYIPLPAAGRNGPMSFAIRSSLPSGDLAKAARQVAASVDPAVPVTEFHTQSELIDRLLRSERLLAFVSAALSIVALALAGVGLGGLLIYSVAQRTNEIGVRMALGANARQIIQLVLGQSLWLVTGGILIGVPLAYTAGRYLESTLFELGPLDAVSAVGSLAALVAIALFATWLPAQRAASVSPMAALREE